MERVRWISNVSNRFRTCRSVVERVGAESNGPGRIRARRNGIHPVEKESNGSGSNGTSLAEKESFEKKTRRRRGNERVRKKTKPRACGPRWD